MIWYRILVQPQKNWQHQFPILQRRLKELPPRQNDSAAGTTNIAQKTVSIAGESAEVMKGVKTAEASAGELRKNVSNFVIEE